MAWICLPSLAIVCVQVSLFLCQQTDGNRILALLWQLLSSFHCFTSVFCILLFHYVPFLSVSTSWRSFSGSLKALGVPLPLPLPGPNRRASAFISKTRQQLCSQTQTGWHGWSQSCPQEMRLRKNDKENATGLEDSTRNSNHFLPWSWHCRPCLPCQLSCKAVTRSRSAPEGF